MTEREQARNAARRLAIIRHAEEVSGNVTLTCRYYGISRHTFCTWRRRYEEQGLDGLRDRSRRPHSSPNATTGDVVGKIVHLRKTYHFGPEKISMYLKRYHDVQVSRSGVWRILKRLEMNRLPSSQRYKRHVDRWKRYEKPQPGHRVQVDVKFVAPLKGSRKKHYQFTAIDDCTRIRVLRIYDRLNQRTAIQFVDYVLEKLPFGVEVIQTDNGAEFQSKFHYHVLDAGGLAPFPGPPAMRVELVDGPSSNALRTRPEPGPRAMNEAGASCSPSGSRPPAPRLREACRTRSCSVARL